MFTRPVVRHGRLRALHERHHRRGGRLPERQGDRGDEGVPVGDAGEAGERPGVVTEAHGGLRGVRRERLEEEALVHPDARGRVEARLARQAVDVFAGVGIPGQRHEDLEPHEVLRAHRPHRREPGSAGDEKVDPVIEYRLPGKAGGAQAVADPVHAQVRPPRADL